MRAVVHDRYGPPEVLRVEDVEPPVPRHDEVLVRVHAATVSRTDTGLRAADMLISRAVTGLRHPKHRILGSDFAGVVAATGATVVDFSVGDRVFGLKPWTFGTHAEFVCIGAGAAVATMPDALSFEEAAAIPDGGILALNPLRPARIRAGQRVLVYGAAGSIGTAGVQLARAWGAQVTAVCTEKDFPLMTSLGAAELIDHTREDFTGNGQTYDVIFDAVGACSFGRCRRSLTAGGVYAATDHLANVVLALWTSRFGRRRVFFPLPPRFTKDDVIFLRTLVDEGRYRPVIDRRYRMDEVVEAHRYVGSKQKTGNVVLVIEPG